MLRSTFRIDQRDRNDFTKADLLTTQIVSSLM